MRTLFKTSLKTSLFVKNDFHQRVISVVLILGLVLSACEKKSFEVEIPTEFVGDIVVSTQQEVDELGSFELTSINGSLTIGASTTISDITDLSPLHTIEAVEGNLTISNLLELENLEGLSGLTTIRGGLYVGYNPSLTSLNGLENLDTLFSITIDNNYELKTIDVFSELENIPEDLVINENAELTELDFSSLTEINGSLILTFNASIPDLSGFSALNRIGNLFDLRRCDSLTSLAGLNLKNTSRVSISGNHNLTDISDFRPETIFELDISSNDELRSFDLKGIPGLDRLYVGNLESLEEMRFSDLTRVRILDIFDNPLLTSLEGFENLTYLGSLHMADNPLITSLEGIKVESMDWMALGMNQPIKNFQGLTELKSLDGFSLYRTQFEDLSGLERIETIRSISIYENEELTSFNGLEQLKIVSHIQVEANPLLTSLEGLDAMTEVGEFAWFIGNVNLSDFCVLDSAVAALRLPELRTEGNAYNPTIPDIRRGDCKQ